MGYIYETGLYRALAGVVSPSGSASSISSLPRDCCVHGGVHQKIQDFAQKRLAYSGWVGRHTYSEARCRSQSLNTLVECIKVSTDLRQQGWWSVVPGFCLSSDVFMLGCVGGHSPSSEM